MRRTTIPPSLLDLAERQAGLVSAAQCAAHGLGPGPTRTLVARREWSRPTRGVYDTCPVGERTPGRGRLVAAWTALLAYGPRSVAVGACALALHGVNGLPPRISPEAAVAGADNRVDRDGLRCRDFTTPAPAGKGDPQATALSGGRRVVPLELALAQAVPELPRANALAVLDDVLHRGRLTTGGLATVHDLARGRRGVARAHELFALADARAESPLESFARLDCIDAGVAPDVLQLPVIDRRGHVSARGDMAWRQTRDRWLVAEIDGRDVHGAPDAVYADRARQNALVSTGQIDVLRFTARDLGQIGSTVRRALNRG
ncbi:hypothetical protein GCM10025865_04590 [Paraoerskovia sediminicola]|uniref:DUF559 domain-containing protein n=1 Tax=Paraoerskovia sediminicola TaxID=1138587 RepID=A0ABM8FZF7_9CELL|nr:hypothetical protein [Paraoerskovia sediminicola]BDZ41160.1 hypothetical protein GCM10025865_04590 [Paraoerskovia sediminicola]